MSAAALDASRWKTSEVVLLDIGKFMRLASSSPPEHNTRWGGNCCNQPPPTFAMHAVFRFAGQASVLGSRQTKTHALARAVSLYLPGRFFPRFCLRHCDLCHTGVSITHSNYACDRYEDTMLTKSFALRRGDDFQYLLCQGCYGKLSTYVKSRLLLQRCVFPAFGHAINEHQAVENP